MTNHQKLLESVAMKFSSLNSTPVERAVITRAEYDALRSSSVRYHLIDDLADRLRQVGYGYGEINQVIESVDAINHAADKLDALHRAADELEALHRVTNEQGS